MLSSVLLLVGETNARLQSGSMQALIENKSSTPPPPPPLPPPPSRRHAYPSSPFVICLVFLLCINHNHNCTGSDVPHNRESAAETPPRLPAPRPRTSLAPVDQTRGRRRERARLQRTEVKGPRPLPEQQQAAKKGQQ